MHVWFLETNALLLRVQHVETKIDAKITRKKWLNKAFTTKNLTETILNQLNNQLINQF